MIQQITLLVAALISWSIDYFTATDEKQHYRVLRVTLLVVVVIAGGSAIYDSRTQSKENRLLRAQVADLARKPELVLIANGLEVTTNRPIVCASSGGVFVIDFKFLNRSDKAASDSTLTVILPDDLQVLNASEWRRMSGSSLPSPDNPARTLHLKNHYQRQLARALFPQSIESIGRILFVESGEKPLTRSVFAEINSIESGRHGMSFDIELK